MAAVDTAVVAIWLTGGGRLVLNDTPGGWEGCPEMEAMFIAQVAAHNVQIVSAGHGFLTRVIEVDGLLLEGDHDANPVTSVHVDGDEEFGQIKEGLAWGDHSAGPCGHVGVVVNAAVGGADIELLGK